MLSNPIELTIISASQRPKSQSARIGAVIKKRCESLFETRLGAEVIDLAEATLPFFSDELWDDEAKPRGNWIAVWQPISERLLKSDAVVLVTPEWGGMATPMAKNLFLLAKNREFFHKPALIVSVAGGFMGGSYPVAELRMSSYKNTQICYIPDHLIIKNVAKSFLEPIFSRPEDSDNLRRMDQSLNVLFSYAQAFRQIRNTPEVVNSPFGFGL